MLSVNNQLNKEIPNYWLFFIITMGISWLIWLPGVLISVNAIDLDVSDQFFDLLNIIGGAVPSVIGIIFIFRSGGFPLVKKVIKSSINVRNIKLRWWFPILFLIPVIDLLALELNVLMGGKRPFLYLLYYTSMGAFWFIPLIFLLNLLPYANPIREEYGWRGYALEELQGNFTTITSALIIGMVWGLWHLPLYFFPTLQDYYLLIPIPIFILDIILISILITWIYNNTNQSMLAVIFFHASVNVSGLIFLNYKTPFGLYFKILLEGIVILLIITFFGHRTMTRPTTFDRIISP